MRRLRRTLALAALTALLCAGAYGGESEATADGDAFRPDWRQVRDQLAATYRSVAEQYIAEHPEGNQRSRVLLVVGALYETGQMGDPDPVLAARYYATASESGLMEATAALANICQSGAQSPNGVVERDPDRARALYEQAAAQGSVPAMLALGIIYADGMNVDPDPEKALSYLVQAARRGDATALDRLAPVMEKARQWEEARPGRTGKSGFPTSRDAMIDPGLVQAFIDRTFDLDRFASHTFVEINKRISATMKKNAK